MQVKKTKAAVLVESKQPLVVTEIDLPRELAVGQVLVKVHYSGICGAQINEIDAVKGPDKFLPHLLGHEGSATVVEAGPGVRTVKNGERVIMHWRQSNGIQCETPTYFWNGRKVNAGWVTTFNEYAVVSENRLTPMPEDFDLKLAPLFGCAITTAMGTINNDAKVKIGQSVVVFGTGGTGLNILQAADMVAAHPIIGIDRFDSKGEMARRFGATHYFNSAKTEDLEGEIRRVVGGAGADVVLDTTGNARVIEQAYKLTHPDGRTVLVGVPLEPVSIYTLPLHFKKVLTGSSGGHTEPHIDIPRYLRLVQAGKLKLDGLITHEFPLDKINEALQVMKSGEAGRVLLAMD
ncbi:MAG: dehydrogenase [Deltaproteobacteria bacterium]|nr:MAG: dehydrogenase [Deltaproteobacteria bacterium]